MALPTGIITYLFTDIEGSTRMVQRLGTEFDEVLADHNQIMRAAIASNDGVEVKTEGDSFFAVFESPLACVNATVASQRQLHSTSWREGGQVQVRMGAHTGEARLGGDDYIGVEVNRAARISSIAHGGQVIISHTTRDLIDNRLPADVELRDLGAHRLKDFDDPERVYQVVTPDLPVDFPPLRSAEVRNNLPTQSSEFVGREAESEAVTRLVSTNRLVTLTGVGGSGKTRLALHVAGSMLDRFPGGVFFVGLDAIADAAGFDQAVAEAIEAPNELSVVADVASLGQALLVLDNFEHIIEAAPRVAELLDTAPELTVLVTSQALLRVRSEQAYAVPVLGLPPRADAATVGGSDSGSLFIRRLWAGDPTFELTEDNAPAIKTIVTQLDGLPLALELAAARVRLFGLDGLQAELSTKLSSLGGGFADAPERHRTLAAAIDWSYQLLDPSQQQILRRAAVFVDGFSLAAAEAVCGDQVVAGLASLLDKSLLNSNIEGGNARFSLLETIRAFGLDRLAQSDELEAIAAAHADFYTAMAIDKGTALPTRESYAAIEQLSIDRANLTAALRWLAHHDPDPGLGAMAVLCRFFELTGSLSEGRELGEDLLAAAGSSVSGRLRGLLGLAHVVYWLRDLDRSAELYDEAVDLAEQLDDKPRLADALIGLAYTYTWQGKREEAAPLMDRAHEAYRADGNDRGVRLVLTAKATDLWIQQDVASAMEIFAEVLDLCREAGDVSEEIVAEVVLAAGLLYFGDRENAIRGILHTLARTTEIGDDGRTTMALDYMSVAIARTDPEEAARLGGAVQSIVSRQGGTVADVSALGLGSAERLTKDALDAETQRRLWEEGMTFDLAAAVEMARAWATANSYSAAAVDPGRIAMAIEANRAD